MANHISSEKRARTSERKRQSNRQYLSSVRTAVKKFRGAIEGIQTGASTDLEAAQKLFLSAQSALARAGVKGIIHTNNAARKIGRLALAWKTATTMTAAGVPAANASAPKAKSKVAAKKPAAAAAAPKAAAKKPASAVAAKKPAPKAKAKTKK